MRAVIAGLVLTLSGCVIQAPPTTPMTPEEQLIAIEQQRANMEQVRMGLEIMRAGNPPPSQGSHCIAFQQGPFTNTNCH